MSDNASAYGHCHVDTLAAIPGQTFTPPSPRRDGLWRSTPVPHEAALAVSQNHPPPRTAPDRTPGRNHDLRDGASRRISATLQAHRPLCRLGPRRGRELDRGKKRSFAINKNQRKPGPWCQAPPISPR